MPGSGGEVTVNARVGRIGIGMESYDSEGKFIGRGRGPMANGDGNDGNKVVWEWIFKVLQMAIIPLLGLVWNLNSQVGALNTRLAVMEAKPPSVDTALIQKIAVMEDRQNSVIRQLGENGGKMDRIEAMLMSHDERWGRKR